MKSMSTQVFLPIGGAWTMLRWSKRTRKNSFAIMKSMSTQVFLPIGGAGQKGSRKNSFTIMKSMSTQLFRYFR